MWVELEESTTLQNICSKESILWKKEDNYCFCEKKLGQNPTQTQNQKNIKMGPPEFPWKLILS